MEQPKTLSFIRKETPKFTWKISNFSLVQETKLYSDIFAAGGHKWRILAFPKGSVVLTKADSAVKYFSLFAEVAETEALPHGWSVPAGISLSVVDQIHGRSLVKKFRHNFKEAEKVLGFKTFVRISELVNHSTGFLVNDTLLIEADVSTETTPPSEQAPTAAYPRASKPDQSNGAVAAREPKSTPTVQVDSANETETQVDGPQPSPFSTKVARSNAMTSPHSYSSSASVQFTSKNLISELSTMSSRWRSNSCDVSLERRKEELADLFQISLEAISKSNSFDDVEQVVRDIADHMSDPIKKMVLEDLVSRLAEFKDSIPSCLSTIETCASDQTSIAVVSKNLEARLGHRQDQLRSLEMEVSRLEEQEMKLDADIQQMVALRNKTRDHKNSTIAELEKANREAAMELDELRNNDEKSKRLWESRLRAKERLAQSNTSWRLFKENLGM